MSNLVDHLERRRLLAVSLELLMPNASTPTFTTSDLTNSTDRAYNLGYGAVIHARASQATIDTINGSTGLKSGVEHKYEIDFGDSGSDYNVVPGFNAAHRYQTSGSAQTYTITLRVTDTLTGTVTTDTSQVTVDPSTNSYADTIYVAPASEGGSSSNSGTSSSYPKETLSQALTLLRTSPFRDSTRILLKKGTTIDSGPLAVGQNSLPIVEYDDVYIGTDSSFTTGSGSDPIIVIDSNFVESNNVLYFNSSTQRCLVKNIQFRGQYVAYEDMDTVKLDGNAFNTEGVNTSIINCKYDDLNTFAKVGRYSVGTLVEGCSSIYSYQEEEGSYNHYASREYGLYVNGETVGESFDVADVVVGQGNYFGRSSKEHNTRSYGNWVNLYSNELIQYNDNEPYISKNLNSLRANGGKNIYWSKNTVRGGTLVICQLDGTTKVPPPSMVVVESNRFYNYPLEESAEGSLVNRMEAKQGASYVVFKNNIVEASNRSALQIASGAKHIYVYHNTFINEDMNVTVESTDDDSPYTVYTRDYNGETGRAIDLWNDLSTTDWNVTMPQDPQDLYTEDVHLVGNLFYAPSLTSSGTHSYGAIKYSFDSGYGFGSNFEPIVESRDNVWANTGSELFFYQGSSTGLTASSWNTLKNASNTSSYDISADVALTGTMRKQLNTTVANIAAPIHGITHDFYGASRGTGTWTAGAVSGSTQMDD